MTDGFLDYLSCEHARLEREIRKERKRLPPDEVQIARLKKLKLAIKDQMQSLKQGRGIARPRTA